ncbi:hypothetical protein KYC5002_44255 [Archangium violaceum]|uniref:hypothetical protein n=1 Tax=Archangium violaceum TaxID=83451 RepID=UPI002B28C75E|nr:hypothetical protein KYC5002_44255 [Archangium gephyra]
MTLLPSKLKRSASSVPGWFLLGILLGSVTGFAAGGGLKYPADCDHAKLKRAANKNGCSTHAGSNHLTVKKNGKVITQIPHTVKSNGTCQGTIKAINTHCGG